MSALLRPEIQDRSRPAANGAASNVTGGDTLTLPPTADPLADLDALAEHLRGVYVVQLVVSDAGHRRSYYYKNLDAAERAVRRARDRGRAAHLTLVQMIPVGVIGGRR